MREDLLPLLQPAASGLSDVLLSFWGILIFLLFIQPTVQNVQPIQGVLTTVKHNCMLNNNLSHFILILRDILHTHIRNNRKSGQMTCV